MILKKTKIIQNVKLFSLLDEYEIALMKDNVLIKDSIPLMKTQRPSNLKCNAEWITYYENNLRESLVFSISNPKEIIRFNNVIIELLNEGILSRDKNGLFLRDYTNGHIIWQSDIKTKKAITHNGDIIVFHGEKNSNISCLNKANGSVIWTIQLGYDNKIDGRLMLIGVKNDILWLRLTGKLIGLSLKSGEVNKSTDESSLGLKGNLMYGYFDPSKGTVTTGVLKKFSRLSLSSNEVQHFNLNSEDSFNSFRKINATSKYIILLDDSKAKICVTDMGFNLLTIEPFSKKENGLKPYFTNVLSDTSFYVKDNHNNLHFYEIQ